MYKIIFLEDIMLTIKLATKLRDETRALRPG
jgi:hypothetical protein